MKETRIAALHDCDLSDKVLKATPMNCTPKVGWVSNFRGAVHWHRGLFSIKTKLSQALSWLLDVCETLGLHAIENCLIDALLE